MNWSNFYDRQGNIIGSEEWGKKYKDLNYKILKQEQVGKYFISTVWVGVDMSTYTDDTIQIFETKIFLNKQSNEDVSNDPIEGIRYRYSTEEQAMIGHERCVGIANGQR